MPTQPILLEEAISEAVSGQRKLGSARPDHALGEAASSRRGSSAGVPEAGPPKNPAQQRGKYSPAGQPIDIRARRSGDEVTISVLDHGPGIDPAESLIVFQPFYRSARTAAEVTGAGIGLAVCRLLVEAQSGHIQTHPRRGGGTVFAFSLPSVA